MHRLVAVVSCVLMAAVCIQASPATSAPSSTRALSVSGTGIGMYPAFDPDTRRYAATTTADSGGALQVTATTSDPQGTVLVDGVATTSATTPVTGLSPGDEVSIVFDDAAGRATYSVFYLPAGFPALHATTNLPDRVAPGLIGLTLNTFSGGAQPSFGAIVDRNGVPVYAVLGPFDTDLKQQPNGEITVSRATTAPGHTGYSLTTLDQGQRRLPELTRRDVVGDLTNTDGHDSVRTADGSTILIGYENDPGTHLTDATIQKIAADGSPTFEWTSRQYLSETTATAPTPTASDPTPYFDYAHINSVVSVDHGDIIASFRHLSAAFRIATVDHDGYHQGDVIWKLGGKDSSFTFPNDPQGGPCAQHTVSQLPNGHILLFDNGTSTLCVHPGTHGFTRAAEFALDTDAGTATLVWAYPGDTSRYALFAGSARRMTNGDTLIGWAADRSALATEVDSAGHTVWNLEAADPPAGQPRYATYRAELITTLRPQLSITGPADGSSVVEGDAVPAAGGCADWLGAPTDACRVSGTQSGLLDTGALGPQTWSVTAEDGAGNTTVVTRHYTVVAAHQPDGMVRKAGRSWWKGGNVYGPASDQAVRFLVGRGHTATAYWRMQNDGARNDAFRLTGTGRSPGMRVHYFEGRRDVTPAVVAGAYVTPVLAAGQATTLRVEVTPTRRSRVGGHRTFTLRSVSSGDPTRTDAVGVSITRR